MTNSSTPATSSGVAEIPYVWVVAWGKGFTLFAKEADVGIYWIYVNDTKREWFDPDALGDNNKWPVHRSGMALFHLLGRGSWAGDAVRAVADYGDEYFWICGEYAPPGAAPHAYPYRNITADVIRDAHFDHAAICVEAIRPAGFDEEAEAPTWLVRLLRPVCDLDNPEEACVTTRTLRPGRELVVWCHDLIKPGDCAIVDRRHVLRVVEQT